MDFLLECNNNELKLYIDSKARAVHLHLLESFSEYFINEVIKRADITLSSIHVTSSIFVCLLKAQNLEDVKSIIMEIGLNVSEFYVDRKFEHILNPKLGDAIPEDWHHRLHADLLNSFRPQELIGYEERGNHFIFGSCRA